MQEILGKMSNINKLPLADIIFMIERLNKFI